MSKRRADVELSQDNWDDDTTIKEVQTFEKADKESMAGRKIITATGGRAAKTGTSGIFKSFTGFSNTASVPPISFNFGGKTNSLSASNHEHPPLTNRTTNEIADGQCDQEAEYLKQLLTLNRNFLDWIEKHVKEDPYCLLTPVFSDYEKHLRSLQEKFPNHNIESRAEPSKEHKAVYNIQFSGPNSNDSTSVSSSVPSVVFKDLSTDSEPKAPSQQFVNA
ncbi:hypothetical protein FGIG_10418, partial [Fasciola gigantica]